MVGTGAGAGWGEEREGDSAEPRGRGAKEWEWEFVEEDNGEIGGEAVDLGIDLCGVGVRIRMRRWRICSITLIPRPI